MKRIAIPVLLLLAAVSVWGQSENSKSGYDIPAGQTYKIDGVAIGSALTACTSSTANDTYQVTCTPEFTAPPDDGTVITFRASAAANTGAATITLTGPAPDAGPYPIYKNVDAVELDDNDILIDQTYVMVFCAACNSAAGAFVATIPDDAGFAPSSRYETGGADPISAANMDDLGLIPHDTFDELTDNDHPQYSCLGCASAELTLDTNGDITIPAGGGVFSLDTFADAATDTLDTIACTAGNSFTLRAENVARVVTIAAASIPIWGAANFAFDEAADRAFGICPATDTPYIYAVFDAAGRIDVQELGVGSATYSIRSRDIVLPLFSPGVTITTGDQQNCFPIPGPDDCAVNPIWCTAVSPMLINHVEVRLDAVDTGAGGVSVMVSRKRMSSATAEGSVDVLTGVCNVQQNEFHSDDNAASGCDGLINASNDDLQPGDRVCADVDVASDGEGGYLILRAAP